MSIVLAKDVVVTTIPGAPGAPGSPGSPGTPAYCVTTTKTTPSYTYQLIALPLEEGQTQVQYQMAAISGPPITSSSTVCYPATTGVAPVAAIPGTADTTTTLFNLGWNAGARSIASLAADGTAQFSVAAGVVGGVVGLDSGAVEFSRAGAEHALYFHANTVSVIESGTARTGSLSYVAADVFRIERSSTVVRYYQNSTLLYTSAVPSYGAQYLEASLYSGGDTVLDASLTDTAVTSGHGSSGAAPAGGTLLMPLAAAGSGHLEGGAVTGYAAGTASMLPMSASASGYAAQGGGAVLQPLQSIGSDHAYASGGAALSPLRATGEAGTAPTFALGVAQLGYIGSAGHGTTAGSTLTPAKSLGDSDAAWAEHVWAGSTVYIVSGTGAGQSLLIADNSGQALLFNTAWSTPPDATSYYEIRDGFGNVVASGYVTPATSAMQPLTGLGSNFAYAGGSATLKSLTSFSAPLIPLSGWAFVAAPMATLYASAHDSSGENAASIAAPMATLSIFMGSGAKLRAPAPTLSASATGENWLTADVAAPAGRLVASATVSGATSASVQAPMASVIGYGGMVLSVTPTGRATLDARMTSGGIVNASITGPMAQLTLLEVTAEGYCSADIIAPMGQMGGTLQAWIMAPMAKLTAVGTTVVVASYEAYAINLNHTPKPGVEPVDEVSRYSNFPFTQIVRYRNSYFGVAADGLYLLEGTTDDGADIPYAVKTATTDFKSPMQKTVASAYFAGRLGSDATVTLHAGEGAQTQPYSYSTPRGALAQNHRQVFGKGIKAHRYYALGLAGAGELALDSIELDTHDMKRRI